MNFLSRYVAYLKRNPEGYWFKRRAYGWGWIPATRQGWLSLAILGVAFAWIIVPFVSNRQPTAHIIAWFVARVVLWIAAFVALCYFTGEPPEWQWGIPDDGEQ